MIHTVQLELLRPEEILAERERCPVVYLPLGPLEWHALHLPLGTDALNAQAVARGAALQTGGVVFPTLFWGAERERPPEKLRSLGVDEGAYMVGMDFPGAPLASLYAPEEVFALLVRQALVQLTRMQYALIVLVNGHGARNHMEALRRLSIEFSATTASRVLLTLAFPTGPDGIGGHAEELETSLMLHLQPDEVDLERLPPPGQPIPYASGMVNSAAFAGRPTPDHTLPPESDPRLHASAGRGQVLFEQTVAEISAAVRDALAGLADAGPRRPPG